MGKGEQGQQTSVGCVALRSSGSAQIPAHRAASDVCARGPCTPALTAPLRARLRPGDGSLPLHLLLDCVCEGNCSAAMLPWAAASES